MMNGGYYDFAELAKRCRDEEAAVHTLDGKTSDLLLECAEVIDNMAPVIEAMPEIVRVSCVHTVRETVLNVAEALDQVGREYAIGKRLGTAQGALRTFAASLRDSQKPKQEGGKKQPLVIQ